MTMTPYRYGACGLEIDCEFPISHLPSGNAQVDADVQVFSGSTVPDLKWDISTPQWRASGQQLQLFGMHGESCVCTAGNRICFYGIAPPIDETFTLLGRALAVICMQRGLQVLHAAVIEKDGSAFAIAGQSGAGKSTLTMEFVRRGYRIVADDIAACDVHQDGLLARPLYPMTRRRSMAEGVGWKTIPGLQKQVSIDVPFCAEPRVLEHLCVLSIGNSGEDHVDIVPLDGEARAGAIEGQLYRKGIARHLHGFQTLRQRLSHAAESMPISLVKRPENCAPSMLADRIERYLERA